MRESPPRVLITGAAHGVGRACAERLAAKGADLVLCDDDGAALRQLGAELGADSRYCDVVSETSVAILAHHLAVDGSGLDALINAAGAGYVRGLGTWRMSRALLPLLASEGGGAIVNVGCPAPAGESTAFAYASSRVAFDRLMAALRDQCRGTGVAVHAVAPVEDDDGDLTARRVVALLDGAVEGSANCEWRRSG